LFPNDGEVELNQQVKDLIQKLGEAINEVEDEPETIDAESDADSASGPFTRNDLTFLKSLRISTEESERTTVDGSESSGEDAPPDA
jgi:hypothetical protein